MNRRNRWWLLISAVLAIVISCSREQPKLPAHVIVTSPLASAGLVQYVASVFSSQNGVALQLQRIERGQVMSFIPRSDIVITSDQDVVASLKRNNLVRLSTVIASDDSVVVGPKNDPALVRRATDAADALLKIHTRRRIFFSPANVSALRDTELTLWKASGVNPGKNRRYEERDGDAKQVLEDADEHRAYTITDRATFDNVRPRNLKVLSSGDPRLQNDVAAILIQRPKVNRDAEWFFEWLMSYRGREAVESYRVNGVRRFYAGP